MASLPFKINIVSIKVRQALITSANMYTDPDYNEPASPITFGDEITMEGQVNLMSRSYEQLLRSLTGNVKGSFGHVLFKDPVSDSVGNPVTLKAGDKITSIAGVTTNLYITEVRPESPLLGGFLLWYVKFSENQETRESN